MKAILVIDMPNTCEDCHLRLALDRYRCINTKENRLRWCGDEDGFYTSDTKPSWCPLRPLPQKTSGHGKTYCMVNSRVSSIPAYGEYDRGWNDCLDAITGDTDADS